MQDRELRRAAAKRAALIISGMVLVVAAVYIAIQLYAILGRTYRTETAIAATMSDSVTVDGVVQFDAVEVAGGGDLGYLVADGERVTAGTVIAERYTDAGQGALRERLDRLERILTLLTTSENSVGSDLSVLTTQTTSALYNLLDQLDTASYTGMEDAVDAFLLAQNRLQISTGQVSSFSGTIAALTAERDGVAAQLEGLETITASQNGYFISADAARPLALDEATLQSDSPAELQALLATEIPTTGEGLAGRIASGFSWRFYGVVDLDTAARFDGVTNVQISVPGKQEEPLDATVAAVETDEQSGLAKLTIECQTINADVLRLGQETARIDLHTYEGIRVNRQALHIVDGERGVYVKYGNLQRFRKITILFEDENYLLVPPDGKVGTDNEVRLYDEIIVEGPNLQDGGLI